jgi:hypothetical protein
MIDTLYNLYAFAIPFAVTCLFYTLFFDYSFVCFSFITAIFMVLNALSDIILLQQYQNTNIPILINLIQIIDPYQSYV